MKNKIVFFLLLSSISLRAIDITSILNKEYLVDVIYDKNGEVYNEHYDYFRDFTICFLPNDSMYYHHDIWGNYFGQYYVKYEFAVVDSTILLIDREWEDTTRYYVRALSNDTLCMRRCAWDDDPLDDRFFDFTYKVYKDLTTNSDRMEAPISSLAINTFYSLQETKVNISSSETQEIVVTIYNAQGQVLAFLYEGKIFKNINLTLLLPSLSPGMYFIVATTTNDRKIERIMIR